MREPDGRTRFPTTQWSRVLAAPGSGSFAKDALAELCAAYWYPLYAFARRSGCDPDRACDMTQGFFARLIEKQDLTAVDPARGRFRSWLLAGLKHFMANEWDRDRTLKRGGGVVIVPIDSVVAEGRYLREPGQSFAPEQIYDRRWALVILERAFARLRSRSRNDEDTRFLERVKPLLALPETDDLASLASELGLTTGALKTRLSRLRERLWGLVRAEIAETLEDPDEVDGELRYLIEVLGAMWRE